MNKRRVNEFLFKAETAIVQCGIANNGIVSSEFRGQISSFCAAVVNGSTAAAIATFSQQRGAAVDRGALIKAIGQILGVDPSSTLFQHFQATSDKAAAREEILDAAVALKIALNLFHYSSDTSKQEQEGVQEQLQEQEQNEEPEREEAQ